MAEVVVTKKPTTKVIDTWKMKKWYKIVSPVLFGSNQIGETIASEDSLLMGRTVKVSLGLVTGDPKKQNTSAFFEITKINNGVAETTLKKMEIVPSSIRRMMRKGRDRIDLSIVCATKDNVLVRIKPFLVTRAFAGGSVLTKMRNLLDAIIRVEANKINYENLSYDVIVGKLQRTIRQRLNKIYPLKSVEIRSFEKTIYLGKLPPVPVLPEIVEEKIEETEEEKIEKKVHKEPEPSKKELKEAEEDFAEVKEEKPVKEKKVKKKTE